MFKKLLSFVISVFFILSSSSLVAFAHTHNTSKYSPRAWPGRPNGHDAIEEWTSVKYGETKGPYVLAATDHGEVKDLQAVEKRINKIGIIIASEAGRALCGGDLCKDMVKNLKGIAEKHLLDRGFYHSFKGTYYTANAYYSGRSIKIVYSTYRDAARRIYVDSYTKYISW